MSTLSFPAKKTSVNFHVVWFGCWSSWWSSTSMMFTRQTWSYWRSRLTQEVSSYLRSHQQPKHNMCWFFQQGLKQFTVALCLTHKKTHTRFCRALTGLLREGFSSAAGAAWVMHRSWRESSPRISSSPLLRTVRRGLSLWEAGTRGFRSHVREAVVPSLSPYALSHTTSHTRAYGMQPLSPSWSHGALVHKTMGKLLKYGREKWMREWMPEKGNWVVVNLSVSAEKRMQRAVPSYIWTWLELRTDSENYTASLRSMREKERERGAGENKSAGEHKTERERKRGGVRMGECDKACSSKREEERKQDRSRMFPPSSRDENVSSCVTKRTVSICLYCAQTEIFSLLYMHKSVPLERRAFSIKGADTTRWTKKHWRG